VMMYHTPFYHTELKCTALYNTGLHSTLLCLMNSGWYRGGDIVRFVEPILGYAIYVVTKYLVVLINNVVV
jgi:hypothetical protein